MHNHPGDVHLADIEKNDGEAYRVSQDCYLSFLQQTTKIQWLELGGENSRGFHQSIKQRRKCNQNHFIQTGEGVWVRNEGEVQQAFTHFYDTLFGSKMANMCVVKSIVFIKGTDLVRTTGSNYCALSLRKRLRK